MLQSWKWFSEWLFHQCRLHASPWVLYYWTSFLMLSSVCHSCLTSCFAPQMDSFLLQASSLTSQYCEMSAPKRLIAFACEWCSRRFRWIAMKTTSYSFPCQMCPDCRTRPHGCLPLSMCLISKVVTAALFPQTRLQTIRTYVTLLLTTTVILSLTRTLMMRNQSSILSNFMISSVVPLSFAFEEWLASSPISDLLRGNPHTNWRHRERVVCSKGGQRA